MKYILAFDLGTSGNKAVLVDEQQNITAQASAGYRVHYAPGGCAHIDCEEMWESCVAAARELTQKSGVSRQDIAAIGLSGIMNGCIAVDGQGSVLYPNIIHADIRTGAQAAHMNRVFSGWYALTGNRATVRGSAAKYLWLKDEQPQAYQNTAFFLQTKDFIRGRLTGRYDITDFSDAGLTGLMDIRRGVWARDVVREIGLDKTKLPHLLPGSRIAGHLTAQAAEQLGLLQGTPVCTGAGDGACSALGAGVTGKGEGYACLGSTAWISAASDDIIDPEGERLITYHDGFGKYLLPTGSVQNAGTALSWAADALAAGGVAELEQLALDAPTGCEGLMFLPWLQGERTPFWDDDLRGGFIGLSLTHTRAHMARAAYEGVALALGAVADVFGDIISGGLTLVGGGAASALWAQSLCDVLGGSVRVNTASSGMTALGAARLAGVSVGLWSEEAAVITDDAAIHTLHAGQGAQHLSALKHKFYDAYRRLKS